MTAPRIVTCRTYGTPGTAQQPTAEDVYTHIVRQKERDSWSSCALGIKGALEILQAGSFFCPPLQKAAGELLGVANRLEQVEDVRSDFEGLSNKLVAVFKVLRSYTADTLPERIQDHLQALVDALIVQQIRVDQYLSKDRLKRVLDSQEDVQLIEQILKGMNILLTTFIMDISLNTAVMTGEIQQDARRLITLALLDKLQHVPEAAFRSPKNKGCLPDTREHVLHKIFKWVQVP